MNFDKKVYYLKRERTKLKYLCISAEPVSFVQRLFYFAKTGDNNLKTKKKGKQTEQQLETIAKYNNF